MNTRPTICIVDYGIGNVGSLVKAFTVDGSANIVVSGDPAIVASSASLVLPGIGAFGAGMKGLKARGLIEPVKHAIASGKPALGICLGVQIMFSRGHEFGIREGLGIFAGDVLPFPPLEATARLPHMGWNRVYPSTKGAWRDTILTDTPEAAYCYFAHSFILSPNDRSVVIAETEYGGLRFVSAVRRGAVYGCQFHPEKSGPVGLAIIKKFIESVQSSTSID